MGQRLRTKALPWRSHRDTAIKLNILRWGKMGMPVGEGWEVTEGCPEVASGDRLTGRPLTVLTHWHGPDASQPEQYAAGPQWHCCLLHPLDAEAVWRILASGTFRGIQWHLEARNRMGLQTTKPFNILIAHSGKRMYMNSWPTLSVAVKWAVECDANCGGPDRRWPTRSQRNLQCNAFCWPVETSSWLPPSSCLCTCLPKFLPYSMHWGVNGQSLPQVQKSQWLLVSSSVHFCMPSFIVSTLVTARLFRSQHSAAPMKPHQRAPPTVLSTNLFTLTYCVLCVWGFDLYVHMCSICIPGAVEVRKGVWNSWNWSHRW